MFNNPCDYCVFAENCPLWSIETVENLRERPKMNKYFLSSCC